MQQVNNAAGNANALTTFTRVIFTNVNADAGVNNTAVGGADNATKLRIDAVADAAVIFIKAALTANGGDSSTLTANQIDAANTAIKGAYATAATGAAQAGAVRSAARDINVNTLYPASANSQLRSVYDSIATAVKQTGKAMFDIGVAAGGDNAFAGTALKAADRAAADSIVFTARAITAPEGNVETAAGRAKVNTLLNNAINILDEIGAQLTGDLDSLEVGKAAIKQQIVALTSAANTILSANYEKLVPELTELRRLVTLLSMALGIEETMLNTIIDKLEGLSR